MIDINELRRLGEGQQWIGRWYDAGCETLMAERDGEHEEVAHPMPIGLVPYLVAVQPAAITELLDRLEAAERSLDCCRSERNEAAELFLSVKTKLLAERDALRAKIERMERQEPVAEIGQQYTLLFVGSGSMTELVKRHGIKIGTKLYALPVAQPAPSVPDDILRDAARYRFLRAAKNIPISSKAARDPVVYDEAIDAAMLAAAPEAKPCP